MTDQATAPLDRYNWFGYLSLENAEAVAERLRDVLKGRWTACSVNEGMDLLRPKVHTSCRLEHDRIGGHESGVTVTFDTFDHEGAKPHVSIAFSGGGWSYSFYTSVPTVQDAYRLVQDNGAVGHHHMSDPEAKRKGDRDCVYFSFEGNEVLIQQRVPAGWRTTLVLKAEDPPEFEDVITQHSGWEAGHGQVRAA